MEKKRTMTTRSAMRQVLLLCMQISENTKVDAFFEYAPHCNAYTVRIYHDGWAEGGNSEYVNCVSDVCLDNLERTIRALAEIYKEARCAHG